MPPYRMQRIVKLDQIQIKDHTHIIQDKTERIAVPPMSLKDDLIGGQSYYMVEIRAVKRILDQVRLAGEEHGCVLCFVDEVLRGTNTVERIAASFIQVCVLLFTSHSDSSFLPPENVPPWLPLP